MMLFYMLCRHNNNHSKQVAVVSHDQVPTGESKVVNSTRGPKMAIDQPSNHEHIMMSFSSCVALLKSYLS